MSRTAKLPGQTAQKTVTQTMVSMGPCLLPFTLPLWRFWAEFDSSLLTDEGTEGEAAEGTEGIDTMEKGSRAVSGPWP